MCQVTSFSQLPMNALFREEGFSCKCGKHHLTDVKEVSVGHGALRQLPELVRKYGGRKPFLIADRNTYQAAGEKVESLLKENGMDFVSYIYPQIGRASCRERV